MGRGAWKAVFHRVTKSDTTEWLSTQIVLWGSLQKKNGITKHSYFCHPFCRGSYFETMNRVHLSKWSFVLVHFCCFCSIAKLCLTVQPHGLQHARLPCPSLSPGVCSDLCPLSWWCHPNHLILCRPLLLFPSIFPSIRVFSNELSFRIRWPKYWSFSFSISPSNEYSGLISFKIDCFDLLIVQGSRVPYILCWIYFAIYIMIISFSLKLFFCLICLFVYT